jgi:hypothetical protein
VKDSSGTIQCGDSTPFDGCWEFLEKVHVIEGSRLKWSNGMTDALSITGDELRMTFEGADITAKMKERDLMTGITPQNQERDRDDVCVLAWDDGDVWLKVPSRFEGGWKWEGCIHQIAGDVLTWSNGKEDRLILAGSELTMMYNGEEIHATLGECGNSLLWSDGDVWHKAPSRFEGPWEIDGSIHDIKTKPENGKPLCRIRWQNGDRHKVSIHGPELKVKIDGELLTATLNAEATAMSWSDGDTWKRAYIKTKSK